LSVIALGLAFLAGCAHGEAKGPTKGTGFVGQDVQRVVAAYGKPESEQDFPDGSRLFAWTRGASADGIPCRVLMAVRRDGTVLEETVGSTCR
jgi:hypothetical protein